MSSQDATLNEKVDFEVLEDVKVGDVVVIQHGAMAIATVTEAQHKRRMGRAGKLNMNIDYVQLVSGEKVPLRAVKGGSGGNHTGAMTGAIVATSIVFFPAAPFFLFMHGKDITIPKGTEITAYTAADTPLDPLKFTSAAPANSSSVHQPQSAASVDATEHSTVIVKSSPDAAEVTIDGKFIGSTPSTVKLAPGEHTVIIDKPGFKSWQRTLSVTNSGSVTVDATLEKVP
ncbi:MAG TPA: PEGA domain-containing protein [Blastocatellia bacterium]|nr:PEGA domain-containing protein [Blastocatellia bacterium]HAF24553.1 PEGA domain-containing protein [Blastocatellia bacterium]